MSDQDSAPRFITSEELKSRDYLGRPKKVSETSEGKVEYYGNSWVDFLLNRRGKPKMSKEEQQLIRENALKLKPRKSLKGYRADVVNGLAGTAAYGLVVVVWNFFHVGWKGMIFFIVVYLFGQMFIPSVQRIHDVGKSAWWLLIPGYNLLLLMRPSDGPNKYGDHAYR